jgi:hypothetical protein
MSRQLLGPAQHRICLDTFFLGSRLPHSVPPPHTQEQEVRDQHKPWQLIMGRFDKETGAALTIQRAWRVFAGKCKAEEYWPSDENPLHWK